MADQVRPGSAASLTATGHPAGRPVHTRHRPAVMSFRHLLASATARSRGPSASHAAPVMQRQSCSDCRHVRSTGRRIPGRCGGCEPRCRCRTCRLDPGPHGCRPAPGNDHRRRAAVLAVGLALHHGAGISRKGRCSKPRALGAGLFQLTAAHYHLNANGVLSFGNAVEEAQGGIRYIRQRYGTADNAVAFRQRHRWY
jgi:hypothetical protein